MGETYFSDIALAPLRQRALSSLAGGYRTLLFFDDELSRLHWSLHATQVLILVLPAVGIWLSSSLESRILNCLIGGAFPWFLNTAGMIGSLLLEKKEPEGDIEIDTVLTRRGFQFLFPARSIADFLLCSALTFLHYASTAYILNTTTAEAFSEVIPEQLRLAGLATLSLAGFSLFSGGAPEAFSNEPLLVDKYQRAVYTILLAAGVAIGEVLESQSAYLKKTVAASIVAYFLQVLAILPSPSVFIQWLAEQVTTVGFGGSPRATGLRTITALVINLSAWALIHWLAEVTNRRICLALCALLAFATSLNFMQAFSIGLGDKKDGPTSSVQGLLANLVFENRSALFSSAEINSTKSTSMLPYVTIIVSAIVVYSTAHEDPDEDAFAGVQIVISLFFFWLQWIVSMSNRSAFCRRIRCSNSSVKRHHVAMGRASRYIIIILLTSAYANFSPVDQEYSFLEWLLTYRAFVRLFTCPYQAAIEAVVLIATPNNSVNLMICSVALNRVQVLIRKLISMAAALISTLENPKLHLYGQELALFISFTVLLPIQALVLLITTMLDSPTIPVLGFPFFWIGFPRPLHLLSSRSTRLEARDSELEQYMYIAMIPQIREEVHKMACADPFSVEPGAYLFFNNGQLSLLIQIIERGNNYMIFSFRGTRTQGQLPEFSLETEALTQQSLEPFDSRQVPFTFLLSPVRSLEMKVHEEVRNNLQSPMASLAFESLLKKAFLRISSLFIHRHLKKSDSSPQLTPIIKSHLSLSQIQEASQFLDPSWVSHIRLDDIQVKLNSSKKMHSQLEPVGFDTHSQEPLSMATSKMSSLHRVLTQNKKEDLEEGIKSQKIDLSEEVELQQGSMKQEKPRLVKPARPPLLPPIVNPSIPSPIQDLSAANQTIMNDLEQMLIEDTIPHTNKATKKPEVLNLDMSDLNDSFSQPQFDNKETTKPQPNESEMIDLDDLNFEGGSDVENSNLEESIDNMFGNTTERKSTMRKTQMTSDFKKTINGENSAEPTKIFRLPAPSLSHQKTIRQPEEPRRQSAYLMDIASLNGGGHQAVNPDDLSPIENFVFQAFHLLFSDKLILRREKVRRIFEGEFIRNFDNREFVDSIEPNEMQLKFIILHSARLAFHYSLEAFLHGERDLSEVDLFENQVLQMDKEWFISNDQGFWVEAIRRRLPKIERLVDQEGNWFIQRLFYGKGDASNFKVWAPRRETIRGIQANQQLEDALSGSSGGTAKYSVWGDKDSLRHTLASLDSEPAFASGGLIISC